MNQYIRSKLPVENQKEDDCAICGGQVEEGSGVVVEDTRHYRLFSLKHGDFDRTLTFVVCNACTDIAVPAVLWGLCVVKQRTDDLVAGFLPSIKGKLLELDKKIRRLDERRRWWR